MKVFSPAMLHFTRAEINWRLALYVVLAIDGFLLSDAWFVAHVGPWVRLSLGAANAGLLVVRAFIDKSPAAAVEARSQRPEASDSNSETLADEPGVH